ncbi:peptidyl-prolyl cis-trans isomerase FKBP11-like [Arapaima gigas]
MRVRTGLVLLWLAVALVAADDMEQEQSVVEELVVETLVKPETCTQTSEMGDTLEIHYTRHQKLPAPARRCEGQQGLTAILCTKCPLSHSRQER